MLRIGHKGADALVPGNTIVSFEKAIGIGVDAIEFDVLWTEDGHPSIPEAKRTPLVVAHDWAAAAAADERDETLTLDAALEAFTRAPLDQVKINLDIKLPGRDDEVFEAVLRQGLMERTMISTMETSTLKRLRELKRQQGIEQGLSLGWTVPKVTRDWLGMPKVIRPALAAGLVSVRVRMPGQVRRGIPELGVDSVWAFFGVVTPRLVATVHDTGRKLYVWTVDDPEKIKWLTGLGVDGICSNDPRLLGD
jgi:glycerophosphoryl diester phosphodiesterase